MRAARSSAAGSAVSSTGGGWSILLDDKGPEPDTLSVTDAPEPTPTELLTNPLATPVTPPPEADLTPAGVAPITTPDSTPNQSPVSGQSPTPEAAVTVEPTQIRAPTPEPSQTAPTSTPEPGRSPTGTPVALETVEIESAGGMITVNHDGSRLIEVTPEPASGFEDEIEKFEATEAKVIFRRGAEEYEIEIHLEDGILTYESSPDDD